MALNLEVEDRDTIIQIIDVVSERGAIKPGEFIVVGELYERLKELNETELNETEELN